MNKRLNVGIIGAGTISEAHIAAYDKCSDAKVTAICDINFERAKAKAERHNITKYYSDYYDLLSDDQIDAVSIVTPPYTHRQLKISRTQLLNQNGWRRTRQGR